MNWNLDGPAAPFLGEEADFDPALAPPPPPPGLFFGLEVGVAFCPVHGYGPCPVRDGAFFCPIHGYMSCPPVAVTPPPEPEVVDAPEGYLNLPSPTPKQRGPRALYAAGVRSGSRSGTAAPDRGIRCSHHCGAQGLRLRRQG
ncbi:hypothetical protein ZWY2020_008727 [Hordeum vulgare]|nr:hypothetical protein ZWY2020_008727 [Hordeum vulgare]